MWATKRLPPRTCTTLALRVSRRGAAQEVHFATDNRNNGGFFMYRLLRAAILLLSLLYAGSAFAAGGTCPSGPNYYNSSGQELVTLSSLGVTGCYYVAANGSDSNPGSSEASPWQHLPGMSGCSAVCASTTPTAGEGFILRGGDTWNGSSIGFAWTWAGTSSDPIYIGVDPNWYSGGSWSRPIWSCGGATCAGSQSGYFFVSNSPYIILDDIEMAGLYNSSGSSPYFVGSCGQNQIFENLYMHGWSHQSGLSVVGGGGFGACANNVSGTILRYNVADGSDTSEDMMVITQGNIPPIIYGNVFRYVQTAIDGCGDNWHDNLVEYMAPSASSGGAHQDAIYQYGPCYASTVLMYDNVVRHITWAGSGGAVKFWMSGNNANTATGYAFNNVIYDILPGNIVDTGGHFGVNYGTWYFFNNTVECGTDSTPGACVLGDAGNKQSGQYTGGTMALYLNNNHWITTGPILSCVQSTWTCAETNDVQQTISKANSQGYTSTGTYAFQPTSANGSTVRAGTDMLSLCMTIGMTDSIAGAACQSDTQYACTYNTANHTVSCPARTIVARTAEPNIGAYQFGSAAQAETPEPPTDLAASVQ
jgi:hypothetical protein